MKTLAAVAFVATVLLTNSAGAANLWCSGTITKSLTESTGRVMIIGDWRGDWTMVCNVVNVWNGIDPDICRNWVAMIDSAKAREAAVVVYYVDNGYLCNTLPTYYSAPTPGYVLTNP